MAGLGGQRFLMTLGAGFVNTALLIGGYIDQGTYSLLTGGTVVTFIGAGATQDIMNKGKAP